VPSVKVKPSLRGVSHQIAAFAAAIVGTALVLASPSFNAAVAASVYVFSLVNLFGTSAVYHIPTWDPPMRQFMRRLDHSAIFILIAGTYTPLVALIFSAEHAYHLLGSIWLCAAIGIVQSVAWPKAPKPLVAALCVALGWVVLLEWRTMRATMNAQQILLLGSGGLFYTLGAIIYALRRPDPFPNTFGYHEVFHALTIIAAICHMIVVAQIVLGSPGD
jgi:hemolysin III